MDAGLVQVIDACVLVNLLATGHIEGILGAAAERSVICTAVRTELIYLRPDDPKDPLQPIDLTPLIDNGSLEVCQIQGDDEELLYIDYAAKLDDGEAMCMALALSRRLRLATDERKARRLFIQATGDPERLISTAQLVRNWAETTSIPPTELGRVLASIQNRARYQPPAKDDPNYPWWIDACR